jgi:hypothetical protein
MGWIFGNTGHMWACPNCGHAFGSKRKAAAHCARAR